VRTRMHATYVGAYLYVTRYTRLYGGSHVTHAHTAHRKRPSIDRRTSAGFHYVRERYAPPRSGGPGLLSAFNDRESAANRQNGSINPRRNSFDANGTRVTRTFLQCKMERWY